MEDSAFHLLDGSKSTSTDASALELEQLKDRYSRMESENLDKIFALTQLIGELQRTLASQTQKSEEDADEQAALVKEFEKRSELVETVNLSELFKLESQLEEKKAHITRLQAMLSSKEAEMEQNFKERTQGMQKELERLQAEETQLTAANQRMRKELANKNEEIDKREAFEGDQQLYVERLHSASTENRTLKEKLEASSAQFHAAQQEISSLNTQVAQLFEHLRVGKAEITRLLREQEANALAEVPVLREKVAELHETIADQEQKLENAVKIGLALVERSKAQQQENIQLREELEARDEDSLEVQGAVSRLRKLTADSAQQALEMRAKLNNSKY
jgi:hypothetical protein